METLRIFLQSVIILGILNVWILRFKQATAWRGGEAKNMREEFATYGLSPWMMYTIGSVKVLLALLLFVGLWYTPLTMPSALIVAALMLGAVYMHIKVKDTWHKALPSFSLMVFSLYVAFA